jgi:hypothetical protein
MPVHTEIPAMTLDELATAVSRATPATPDDAPRLQEATALLSGEKLLSVGQVTELLGISSPTTVRNWLEGGYFPNATRTAGGHRRFPLKDVLRVEAMIARTRAANASDRASVTDLGDVDPFARRQAQRDRVMADRVTAPQEAAESLSR